MSFFELIGLLFSILFLFKIMKRFYSLFIRTPYNMSNRYGEKTWAIITGASDGIGKQFCFSLAARKFNIILIARNKNKLEQVSQDLKNKYPEVLTKIIIADFSSCLQEEAFYEKILQEIKHLEISILVNNVGMSQRGKLFVDIPKETLKEIITVNCFPQALLSNHLLKRFLQREKRSAIINISSMITINPVPYSRVYATTKMFNKYYSEGIDQEYFDKIDSIAFCPFFVTTKMCGISKPKGFAITCEDAVENCLKNLGYERSTYGHIKHEISQFYVLLAKTLPRQIVLKLRKKMIKKQIENVENYERNLNI